MITLRPATMDDRDILMQWRNEYSFVNADQHDTWLADWIQTMRLINYEGLFIAQVGDVPIGTGRITMVVTTFRSPAQIHYSIATLFRRHGYGKELVTALVEKARMMGYADVIARIKRDNQASLQCALMGGVTAVEFL